MKRGSSLLETTVAFGIIAMAVSLSLPAIVSSREETRVTACLAQLRTMGLAWNEHELSLGFYPSSGFTDRVTGDPDRGFGRTQPGGWAYDILAFTGHADLRSLGSGLPWPERDELRVQFHQTVLQFANCPARRPAQLYIYDARVNNLRLPPLGIVRGDYRANSGNVAFALNATATNGPTAALSETSLAQVTDGASKTAAIVEKYLNPFNYFTVGSVHDNETFYRSMSRDTNAYLATMTSAGDSNRQYLPARDRSGFENSLNSGGAHKQTFNVAFCDSAARSLSFDVDYRVLSAMGGRSDGEPFIAD